MSNGEGEMRKVGIEKAVLGNENQGGGNEKSGK